MQMIVYVCYDRSLESRGATSLFFKILNRQPLSWTTTNAYYISKAARQILQTLSSAGMHQICKAARGAKTKLQCWTCSTYFFLIKSLMTANPIPMNNTAYVWTYRTGGKKELHRGRLLILYKKTSYICLINSKIFPFHLYKVQLKRRK